MGIKCGKCTGRHDNVAAIRACHDESLFTCTWLVDTRQITEDGEPIIIECGRDGYPLPGDRGTTCSAGHENVSMETQWREGWAYVDAEDAAGYARDTLRTPVLMDGHAFIG